MRKKRKNEENGRTWSEYNVKLNFQKRNSKKFQLSYGLSVITRSSTTPMRKEF